MASVAIIAVPFDSGLRDARMGRGPTHLLELGIADRIRTLGLDVEIVPVEPPADVFPAEIRIASELQREVARAVSRARERGAFPLVLSGNCNAAVGVVAGLRAAGIVKPAVCWFDAHADFNTPESTIGGFFDGMALSMLTGHCWHELAAQVPEFDPVPESRVLLIGARDIDPLERQLLDASSIRVATRPRDLDAAVDTILSAGDTRDIYLHLDLDALDASEGRANQYAVDGGLSRAGLLAALRAITSRGAVRAASITAYDPSCDSGDRVGGIAIEAALTVVQAAAGATDAPAPSRALRA